jgi:hypothetical protein
VKRLVLLALLVASSSLVAAPAPMPKPQRKAERPSVVQRVYVIDFADSGAVENLVVIRQALGGLQQVPPPQQPAQPPNADPPG